MVSRRGKPSLLANFKFSVDQYLRETTVHGFRYLVEGRNVCEIIVWSIVISFCFVLTFFGIYSSVRGSYDNPILTSVQTTEIQKVVWKESTLSVLSNKLIFLTNENAIQLYLYFPFRYLFQQSQYVLSKN